jgi:uncharacterized protein (TIGR00730 family)
MRRICVFAGSNAGARQAYAAAATALANALVARNYELVYGGSNIGLMSVLADTMLAAGGRVIGVIPEALTARERAHTGLTELHHVGSMHERKAEMNRLADAFIALPGGAGTLDELFEAFTWAQLGLHKKPIGLLNACGYYDPLLAFLHHAVEESFISSESLSLLHVHDIPDLLLDALAAAS